ncbi:5-dehydro-4-deoxy-D-glucuronate isomerase [Gracilinema caldarium]|uniref:4-deoxy-L-threo-5-hexosulose-uronate ketol-isomerase n=1 Tax=Gracilinema caldarium (strain ATCC 51460 / DSM 7334 / H1) TaxID=744872 RepID=F8F1D7_GRAC1|nr:5-dehydro-4-deoxy-D-glucuronate isomerase [Gracilinema caldarium]AEJ18781.1 4-deoxy-L-threo-5-hexosulose-uronateketol-isomerase [Gracilinema caldarium DSM 7334]
MQFDIRYANHPEDAKQYDTKAQRKHFLVEQVFTPGELRMTYSHQDRLIFGGAMPIEKPLELEADKELGTTYFLERRELGLINIGGPGRLVIDGAVYDLTKSEGAYVGMGTQYVRFESKDPTNPAKWYMASAPAHQTYPTVTINLHQANPKKLGSSETSNERTIYQYVHPAVCKSCQLVMGMTILSKGSVWNTMPCHTHERRMEAYFYFDMEQDTRVFHFFGRPEETRHLVVANEQAVISPSWSIHSGVGTASYTFIWAMAGENQTFDDMDFVKPEDLK